MFMRFDLDFSTDYGQFYICDKNFLGDTDSENFWTDKAFNDKIAVEDGILGISIGNQEGIVKCELIILNSKNLKVDFDEFDHIVEASLKIDSGFFHVLDCPNSEVQFETEIENGEFRARVYSKNLALAFNENPQDSYLIEIWKEEFSKPIVLKKFST